MMIMMMTVYMNWKKQKKERMKGARTRQKKCFSENEAVNIEVDSKTKQSCILIPVALIIQFAHNVHIYSIAIFLPSILCIADSIRENVFFPSIFLSFLAITVTAFNCNTEHEKIRQKKRLSQATQYVANEKHSHTFPSMCRVK